MSVAALDVLVVGAGPVGVTIACELIRHGLSCRIIDVNEHPSLYSKAQVIHTRTLEILEDMGVIAPFLAQGRVLHGVSIYTPDMKRIAHMPFALESIETRYPHSLSISQRETESLLIAHLEQLGGKVERQVKLENFSQTDDQVMATLLHPSGQKEELKTSWLIGCDGAHSTVRKVLQMPFEGTTYEQRIIQADVRIDWELQHGDDEVIGFLGMHGVLGIFPLPGPHRYRMLTFLDPEEPLEVKLETFAHLLATRGPQGARVSDPAWMVDFRFHRRMVPRYRSGRVFLAGDAAHIHSPAGGQGMNTGMQDSYNLAWKLALCHRGVAHPSLLDSYHAERHPVAAATLRTTDALTRRASSLFALRHPIAVELREHLVKFITGLEMLQHRAARALSMLEVAYPDSPIVAEDRTSALAASIGIDPRKESPTFSDWLDFGHGPTPGERAIDAALPGPHPGAQRLFDIVRGTQHTLLLFDGAAATEEGYRRFADIDAKVRERYDRYIKVYIVVPRESAPTELLPQSSILFDSEGELHRRYGARSECLFLLRPDKYVAYRGQPADADKLFSYLKRIFISCG